MTTDTSAVTAAMPALAAADTSTDTTAVAPAPSAPLDAASALGAVNAPAPAPSGDTPPADPNAKPAEPGLSMSGKDATPEQWGEFYAKLGRPETPEGYELPVPDGQDGEFAKTMAPMLHKHGLSAAQAKGLAEDWNAMVAGLQAKQAEADAAQAAQTHAKNTAEAATLKTEWGQQHDANMEYARRAMTQFLPKERAADVVGAIESKLGYAATIKFLHGIGKGLAEHDAAGMGQNNSGKQTLSLGERIWGPDKQQP